MKFLDPTFYQPIACDLFDSIRDKFIKLIPEASFEHIGSSAIEGAVSKGDLDIFVGVPLEAMEKTISVFEKEGFAIKQDTFRCDELCMLESKNFQIPVAIQIVAIGSKYEFFLEFRDKLNASGELKTKYNDMKLKCAGASEEFYRIEKTKFIEYVLGKN